MKMEIVFCGELTLMVATKTNRAIDFYTFCPSSLLHCSQFTKIHKTGTENKIKLNGDVISLVISPNFNSFEFDSDFENGAGCVRVDV